MANEELQRSLEFANLQMASEAFLLRGNESTVPADQVASRLQAGNLHASKFMVERARDFARDYEVLAQIRNDPLESSGTGFSGTLFRKRSSGELTLSFRSTEFIEDALRDSKSTNELEIKELGWAFGQISAMEKWYAELSGPGGPLDGKTFNVTGYSLGGHLATAFNLLRQEEVALGKPNPVIDTYTFNGAGVGGLRNGASLSLALRVFESLRADPGSGAWTALSELDRSLIQREAERRIATIHAEEARLQGISANFEFGVRPPAGEQASLQYQIAALVAARDTMPVSKFPFVGGLNWIPTEPNFAGRPIPRMTEIVGSDGGRLGPSFVANSGMHYGERLEIYIEDQPRTRGSYVLAVDRGRLISNPQVNDFADTHSLVLLVDSLSLLAVFESLDPDFTAVDGAKLLAAMSSSKGDHLHLTQGEAEGDTLERTLDALRNMVLGPGQMPTLPNGNADTLRGNTWHLDVLRRPFHENLHELNTRIDALRRAATGPTSLVLLGEFTRTQNAEIAATDTPHGIANRFALRELIPFAIVGLNYEQYNADGSLDLYNAAEGSGTLTTDWLLARAEMLDAMVRYNKANGGAEAGIKERYEDLSRNLILGPAISPRRTIFGTNANESFSGASDSDKLFGGSGDDIIAGNGGHDVLEGGNGMDVLEGGSGNDSLRGGQDDDRLLGGTGDDTLDGGIGFDTYVHSSGDGLDTIRDADGFGQVQYKGRVLLGANQTGRNIFEDAHGTRYLLAGMPGGGRALVIDDAIMIEDFVSGQLGITLALVDAEEPDAGDGSGARTYLNSEFPTDAVADPSIDDGTAIAFNGSNVDDFVSVGAGYAFQTRGGADEISIGAGSAQALFPIDAGAGDDVIDLSGAGDSPLRKIAGGSGNDYVRGSEHADTIYGDNYSLQSSATVPGGFTLDWFKYNLSAESSTLVGVTPSEAAILGASGAGTGFLNLLSLERSGSDVHASSVVGLIQQEGWYLPVGASQAINYVLGASSSFDDYVSAGAGNDIVNGGSGSDEIYGEGGDDSLSDDDAIYADAKVIFGDALGGLFGLPGDDYLDGGAGADTLRAGIGNDTLVGGDGDDRIISTEFAAGAVSYYNHIEGGEGNDHITVSRQAAGLDTVFAGSGNDRIEAGSRGFFDGGDGDDVYVVSGGVIRDTAGFDRVSNVVIDAMGQASQDFASLMLPNGLPPPAPLAFNVDVTRMGSNLVLTDHSGLLSTLGAALAGGAPPAPGPTGGPPAAPGAPGAPSVPTEPAPPGNAAQPAHIVFLDWFSGPGNRIEQAGNLSAAQFERWGSFRIGTAGIDDLRGREHTDRLGGGAGDDMIAAAAGNDLIAGNTGNDHLDGGTGDDAYFYVLGDGNDTIADAGGFDVLRLGTGISRGDLTLTLEDGAMRLRIGSASIALAGSVFDGQDACPLDELRFADGSALSMTALAASAIDVAGSQGDNFLRGSSGANVFTGGAGNDVLAGGPGSDTYRFNLGDGFDTIVDGAEAGSRDIVIFGAGIAPSDLHAESDGGFTFITIGNAGDLLEIAGSVSELLFASGESMTLAALLARDAPPAPVFDRDGSDVGGPTAPPSTQGGSETPVAVTVPPPESDFDDDRSDAEGAIAPPLTQDGGERPPATVIPPSESNFIATENPILPPAISETSPPQAPQGLAVVSAAVGPIALEETAAAEPPRLSTILESADTRNSRVGEASSGDVLPSVRRDTALVGVASDPVYREIDARLDVLLQAGRANLSERYSEAVQEFERRRDAAPEEPPPSTPEEVGFWNEAVHAWHANNPGFDATTPGAQDGAWGGAWAGFAHGAPTFEELVSAGGSGLANPHALARLSGAGAAPGLREGIAELRS